MHDFEQFVSRNKAEFKLNEVQEKGVLVNSPGSIHQSFSANNDVLVLTMWGGGESFIETEKDGPLPTLEKASVQVGQSVNESQFLFGGGKTFDQTTGNESDPVSLDIAKIPGNVHVDADNCFEFEPF